MSFSITAALALLMTLGQIFLNNGEFKTRFEPHETAEAISLLRSSCRMVMADDDIKSMNPEALLTLVKAGIQRQNQKIEKAVASYCEEKTLEFRKLNPGEEAPNCNKDEALAAIQEKLPKMVSPISEPLQIFTDFDINDAIQMYDFLCAQNPSDEVPTKLNLSEVLDFYNRAMSDSLSVDLNQFNQPVLPRASLIYSGDGKQLIGEVFQNEGRRHWVPLNQIPEVVRHAFISAEDKNFYSHSGVELRGVLRGFLRYIKDKTIVGGSTLTQQVVKNLVLSSDVTLERKVKEMIIATRLEKLVSKDKILEIYLNLINLGRHSWGIQTATESYFGTETFVSQLGLNEASFLAGVTHSPNRYEPEFNFDRIVSRQKFVLREMKENGYITEEQQTTTNPADLKFVKRKVLQSSYFHRSVEEDINKRLDPYDAKHGGLYLFSTQIPSVQAAMEKALQERLFQFELKKGRLKWSGALGNLLPKAESELKVSDWAEFQNPRFWTTQLKKFKTLYSDIHWEMAVVLDKGQNGKIQMGYVNSEGKPQFAPLYTKYKTKWASQALRELKNGDVIFVTPLKDSVALRVQPQVQGAAIAMEAKTGKVLAVSGGFSFHDSELNRATHSMRQPGSTVKPFTYLAAFNQGIQPNQVLRNSSIRFPPIYLAGEKKIRRNMKCNSWSVSNYSSGGASQMTVRRALETSNNRATAHLLKSISSYDPEYSLNLVKDIFVDFGVYEKPQDCYPVILGSGETSLVKMAAAYAAIANGGTLVEPHFLDESLNAGLVKKSPKARQIYTVDPVALFQVKNVLKGAVERGTGFALREYAGLVAGKTGTSSDYNDAWFMGFSNDIVVGIWVGYDNASSEGKRGLGSGGTGGSVAAPIAKEIFEEAFKFYPPTQLLDQVPAGVKLYTENGYQEAFRDGYSPSFYNNNSMYTEYEAEDDSTYGDSFYFPEDSSSDLDPYEEQRNKIKSEKARRAVERGQGGLY